MEGDEVLLRFQLPPILSDLVSARSWRAPSPSALPERFPAPGSCGGFSCEAPLRLPPGARTAAAYRARGGGGGGAVAVAVAAAAAAVGARRGAALMQAGAAAQSMGVALSLASVRRSRQHQPGGRVCAGCTQPGHCAIPATMHSIGASHRRICTAALQGTAGASRSKARGPRSAPSTCAWPFAERSGPLWSCPRLTCAQAPTNAAPPKRTTRAGAVVCVGRPAATPLHAGAVVLPAAAGSVG